MRAMTSCTSGRCEPERIDRPTTCTFFSAAAATIASGGQADAVVDHLHAGVARAGSDLLGAVGMAVEAGLADQEFQPPAEFFRHAVDFGADVVEALGIVAHGGADAGRRAVFAEGGAQRKAPFAGGDAGFGAGDRGRHDVAAGLRRLAQRIERGGDRLAVARGAPGREPRDLVGLGFRRHGEDRLRRRPRAAKSRSRRSG